ncbi:unnamed protein product [Anisakis simplex]|uniref:Anosmin-1 (inferred by orthology to a human protein) n=1 Tax=Anisakis simplex TaxID=6269 RepID=A0A0M3JZB6_ANISI|nr:unnamed protein product [Anisakis simplex]
MPYHPMCGEMMYRRNMECAVPCRELFIDVDDCHKKVCKDVKDRTSCKQSCEYLQRIYAEKPGICMQSTEATLSDECSAICRWDGDCSEANKCCVVGCSRRCLKPVTQDARLLPIPTRVSVQERKRKRSAIVRWVMQQMKRHHTTTNANLYVLQWRWSVRKDEATMTDWQTIMVKNKMYAIMKHLLSPGRYYTFRVAAVNVHGSLGFSASSPPFKLSKEARAPAQPRDLTLGSANEDSDGFWTQKLSWKPPQSDLPIKNYILSWQKSFAEKAAAYERMMRMQSELGHQEKRSTSHEEDDGSDGSFMYQEQQSIIVPPYETSAFIDGLLPLSIYLVKVRACVDSSDGELHGDNAIIFVHTAESSAVNNTNKSVSHIQSNNTQTLMQHESETHTVASLEIKTPYYEKHDLKTSVSWLNSKDCSPIRTTFVVRWRLMECQSNDEQKRTFYDLDTSGEDEAEIRMNECVAVLDGLNFGCSYTVEVRKLGEKELTASGEFRTKSCKLTPSAETVPREEVDQAQLLSCTTDALQLRANCRWRINKTELQSDTNLNSYETTLVGFRVSLQTVSQNAVSNNISIIPANIRDIQFTHLQINTHYNVRVEAILNRGLGETMNATFVIEPSEQIVNSQSSSSSNDIQSLDQYSTNDGEEGSSNNKRLFSQTIGGFSGAEVIELPLGSSAVTDVRWLYRDVFICFCLNYIFRNIS